MSLVGALISGCFSNEGDTVAQIRTQTASITRSAYIFKRAIRESLLASSYSETDRDKAFQFFEGCAFCGDPNATRNDHLVSVAKGGEFIPQNVVPACQPCDDSKGSKAYRDWMVHGNSKKSLRIRRQFSDEEIAERIRKIEEWVGTYVPKSNTAILGAYLEEYESIIRKVEGLAKDARRLITLVKAAT